MNIFDKIIKIFEKIIIYILIAFMAVVLVVSAVEVGIIVITQLLNPLKPDVVFININGLMEIFGFFLIILIGFELFETVKLYLRENVFHGEVILLVSLIAVSRKVIVLDFTKEDPMTLFAMASLVAAISFGYYLLKKSMGSDKPKNIL